ncbi:hypothetical protein GCM10022204_44610 [Microlunatus aurantiacus]|uniref:Uncharacterized protein n=1 Tax=Microlunatus aurantiacus TaxID=446786 RepID=A0ABP7ELD2_9ACTN
MDDRSAGWRADRIGSALRGTNPTVMAKLPGAFAVIGDVQWLPGYWVLLVDRPGVGGLTDLDPDERQQYLVSMDILGEAVESACRGVDDRFRRLNLDILGNTDELREAALHSAAAADAVTGSSGQPACSLSRLSPRSRASRPPPYQTGRSPLTVGRSATK